MCILNVDLYYKIKVLLKFFGFFVMYIDLIIWICWLFGKGMEGGINYFRLYDLKRRGWIFMKKKCYEDIEILRRGR